MSWYSEVFDLVFPDIDKDEVNKVWASQLAKPEKASDKSDEDD